MATIGLILAGIGGLIFGVFGGMLFDSILVGIIATIVGWGFLYGQWLEASVPYNIQDIRDEMKNRK